MIDTYSVIIFSLLGFFMKLLWSRYPTYLTYNEQAYKRRKNIASIYWNINLESTKLLNCHSLPHLLRSVLSYSNSLLPWKWVYTLHKRTLYNINWLYLLISNYLILNQRTTIFALYIPISKHVVILSNIVLIASIWSCWSICI